MTAKENKVIRRFYIFSVFFQLLLWVPIFYEAQRLAGLNDQQIFAIQSIYYLIFSFLEIPTGFLSDRVGHRKTIILGAASLAIANLIPTIVANYLSFLVHFLLIALSRSLISGAASAFIYDYLLKKNSINLYREIEGTARALSLATRVIGWSAAGYLLEASIHIPYAVTFLNSMIALWAALQLPVSVEFSAVQKTGLRERSKKIFQYLWSSQNLLPLMIQGVGVFMAMRILLVNLFQPLMLHYQLSLNYFGFVMGGLSLIEAFGNRCTKPVLRCLSPKSAIWVLSLIMSSVFLVLISNRLEFALPALACFSFAAGIAYPIQKQLINQAIEDTQHRATYLSIESILDRLGCAIILIPIGPLIHRQQYADALMISAISVLMMASAPMLVRLTKIKVYKH